MLRVSQGKAQVGRPRIVPVPVAVVGRSAVMTHRAVAVRAAPVVMAGSGVMMALVVTEGTAGIQRLVETVLRVVIGARTRRVAKTSGAMTGRRSPNTSPGANSIVRSLPN